MSNSLPKLSEVVHILKPLSDKYFDLGIQLQLDHKKLKKIEREYADQERRFNETIILWRDSPGECSWSALATAVERVGGHDKLAKALKARDPIATKGLVEDPKPQRHDSATESADDNSSKSQSEDSSGSETECFELASGCGCTNKKPCSLNKLCEGRCPNPTSKRVPVLRKKSKAAAQCEIPFEEEHNFEESTRDIQKSFGEFGLETSRHFKENNVSIKEVNLYLQGAYPVMKPRMDELSKATSFDDVFRIIEDQACSWFDYEIIKDLILHFCDSAKSCLKVYEAHFKKYAEQRHPPKGMKHIEVGSGAKRGGKQLVIKIDREWEEVTFSDLDKLRGTFASVLGIRRRDLYLADIREGCIMMTFMITEELAGRLFPSRNCLTSDQIKSLKDEGVISVTCGDLKWRAPVGTNKHVGSEFKLQKGWCQAVMNTEHKHVESELDSWLPLSTTVSICTESEIPMLQKEQDKRAPNRIMKLSCLFTITVIFAICTAGTVHSQLYVAGNDPNSCHGWRLKYESLNISEYILDIDVYMIKFRYLLEGSSIHQFLCYHGNISKNLMWSYVYMYSLNLRTGCKYVPDPTNLQHSIVMNKTIAWKGSQPKKEPLYSRPCDKERSLRRESWRTIFKGARMPIANTNENDHRFNAFLSNQTQPEQTQLCWNVTLIANWYCRILR